MDQIEDYVYSGEDKMGAEKYEGGQKWVGSGGRGSKLKDKCELKALCLKHYMLTKNLGLYMSMCTESPSFGASFIKIHSRVKKIFLTFPNTSYGWTVRKVCRYCLFTRLMAGPSWFSCHPSTSGLSKTPVHLPIFSSIIDIKKNICSLSSSLLHNFNSATHQPD